MKKIISSIIVLVLFSGVFKFGRELNSVHAFSKPITVIVKEKDVYDLDLLYSINNIYENISIIFIEESEFNSDLIPKDAMVCLEVDLLADENIREFVGDYLLSNYIYFLGPASTSDISRLYGNTLTKIQNVYSYQDGLESNTELIESKLVEFSDENITVLKYTENRQLKLNMKKIHIEGDPSAVELLVPCCMDYIEESNNTIRALSIVQSSDVPEELLLTHPETGLTRDHKFIWLYVVYKNKSESDSSKDYYLFKSTSYFTNHGMYLVTSDAITTNNSYSTAARPTNSNSTTSWSFNYSGVSYTYQGASVKISLTSPTTKKNQWVFQGGTSAGTNFDSGDRFVCLSEFAVPQGTLPSFEHYIYAIDNYALAGKLTKTFTVRVR